jgi:hypothetical protein
MLKINTEIMAVVIFSNYLPVMYVKVSKQRRFLKNDHADNPITLVFSGDMMNWTDHGEVFKVALRCILGKSCFLCLVVSKEMDNSASIFPDGGSTIGVVAADKTEGS